jgi:hypothetical protein
LVVIVIAWSLYHSPPRCAGRNRSGNGFLRNPVFGCEKPEKILDFSRRAQRGRCARDGSRKIGPDPYL